MREDSCGEAACGINIRLPGAQTPFGFDPGGRVYAPEKVTRQAGRVIARFVAGISLTPLTKVPIMQKHDMEWQIPNPLATAKVPLVDGGTMLLRRHGNPCSRRLLISHANGLSSDASFPFWSLLAEQFDIILFDLRGHGANPSGELTDHNVAMTAQDSRRIVRAVDRHFGENTGEPIPRGPWLFALQVHPRVCGGTDAIQNGVSLETGLYPRVRGNRPSLRHHVLRQRSIRRHVRGNLQCRG